MANHRTLEKLNNAKKALLEAFNAAQDEKLPEAILRQIDALAGRTEALENKIAARS